MMLPVYVPIEDKDMATIIEVLGQHGHTELAFKVGREFALGDHSVHPEYAPFLEAARTKYGDDELEFDDNALLSRHEDGAFVMAWRWITNTEAGVEPAVVQDDEQPVPE